MSQRSFPSEYIDELKSRLSIETVVSSYTDAGMIGKTMMAVCPFHSDTEPSMVLHSHTNTFYCYTCHAGSKRHSKVRSPDIIGFVQAMENLSFPDTVEKLAVQVGMPMPSMSPEAYAKAQEKQQRMEYFRQAQDFFRQSLRESQKALNYLGSRGFMHLEVEMFGLGFGALHDDENLRITLDRLTFPIHDYDGNIAGFAARVLYTPEQIDRMNQLLLDAGKKKIRKYLLNPGFERNEHLYGLHLAQVSIRKFKTAILTEGFTDVMNLHAHGATHAVSTMGVNLSETHVKLLKRAGAEKVIIMRDGDEAGIIASESDADILNAEGIECYILPLEDGIDPDDLCRMHGYFDDGLSKYINKHKRLVHQYKIDAILRQTQEEILYHYSEINSRQKNRLDKVVAVLATVQDPILLDIYTRQVADSFNVSYDSIKQALPIKKQQDNNSIGEDYLDPIPPPQPQVNTNWFPQNYGNIHPSNEAQSLMLTQEVQFSP